MSTFEWSQLAARVSALERRQSNPDIEARVSALEQRQVNLETRIEEVNRDATTNFKELTRDMTGSFKQLSVYLGKIEDNNEQRFQSIETTLGEHTKILGEHSRILGEHSKILGEHTKILDDHTKRLGNIETLLTQILARLPENR